MIRYVAKPCLFCAGDDCAEDLYPRNFRDEDLTPEIFSARRVTEHFHYRMVRCRRTGLVFSREILPETVLQRLYAGSKVTFQAYADVIRRDYWRPLEARSSGLRKDAALEIGCSSGFFLEELKARGFRDVQGCEPSVEAKAMASPSVRDGIRTGFFSADAYPDSSFDLICAFQTLDHLADPKSFLDACLRKLRPGGFLYVIVHHAGSLQAKVFGEKSPIIDVEHIYLFTPPTLKRLAEGAGFAEAETFPVRNSYPLKYWLTHAPLPGRSLWAALAGMTGLDRVRIPLSAGNMGLLARKPAG